MIQSDNKTRFSKDHALNLLYTSIAFGSCVMLAYPISGGCLNPAIGVGINIVNVIAKGEASAIEFIYLYLGVPFGGALLAVIFYERVYKEIQISNNSDTRSLSVIEQFYQKKSKEIFDKKGYNEGLMDNDDGSGSGKNKSMKKKELTIDTFDEWTCMIVYI